VPLVAWRDRFRWGRKSASDPGPVSRDLRRPSGHSWPSVNLDTALGVSTLRVLAPHRQRHGAGPAQADAGVDERWSRTRLPAKDHPLYDVIGRRPNPWQTSFEFRQLMSWHVELCGNFYAFKNAPLDEIRELIPFEPDEVRRFDAPTTFRSRTSCARRRPARSKRSRPRRSGTCAGPAGTAGWASTGLQAARDAIGPRDLRRGVAGRRCTRTASRRQGIYSVEGKLNAGPVRSAAQVDRPRARRRRVGRQADDHGPRREVAATQMSGVDAQHLETRGTRSRRSAARWACSRSWWAIRTRRDLREFAEQMFLAHLVHTLSPRWQMYEQSMDTYLLTDAERKAGSTSTSSRRA
jgi:hypothetical protein